MYKAPVIEAEVAGETYQIKEGLLYKKITHQLARRKTWSEYVRVKGLDNVIRIRKQMRRL